MQKSGAWNTHSASPGFMETQRSTSASSELFERRASRDALRVTTMSVASLEIWVLSLLV